MPQAGTGSKIREHYHIRHIDTSILKKLLDVSYLVIGNKVASLTNLHQCLQEHSICISYMALKGINTPSLYIDQQDTEKEQQSQIFQVYHHITGLGNLTIKSLITSKNFPRSKDLDLYFSLAFIEYTPLFFTNGFPRVLSYA